MEVRVVPDLNGFAGHVYDGGRLLHVSDPAPTRAEAEKAARRWAEGAGAFHAGRSFGWDEEYLRKIGC